MLYEVLTSPACNGTTRVASVALRSFHHIHFDGHPFCQSLEDLCHHDLTCKMDILICTNINKAIPLVRDQAARLFRTAVVRAWQFSSVACPVRGACHDNEKFML